MSVDALNRAFSRPNTLRFDTGAGGLVRALVTHPRATAELYLHGAHVTAWTPADERPMIWMSERSHFQPDKPIRGGVPICFPWFGAKADDPAAPSHGTARISEWRMEDTRADDEAVTLRLGTTLGGFAVTHTVAFGRELRMTLAVTNRGGEARFEAALHTYFAISDIRRVAVRGLEHVGYLDQLAGRQQVAPTGTPITFAGEIDRIYIDAGESVTIEDPDWGRVIRVAKRGSRSTVVWNPWVAKAARMPDFGDHEWPGMLCVETANIGADAVSLPTGGVHEMTATIGLARL